MQLYAGTSGFKYKPWKGPFYPAKLPDKEMLRFYGGQCRAVEVNSTFRTVPRPATLEAWAKRVKGQGWREAFVFFRHEDEGKGPRLAKRFRELAG